MARDFCINHGWVESPKWKLRKEGNLCHLCFKSKRTRAGFLTGASPRIREDQERCERELIQPFGKGGKANPEFLKSYPDHATDYYSQKELKELHAERLPSRKSEEFKPEDRPEAPPGVIFEPTEESETS